MNFNEKLNEYIEKIQCTAKELSVESGLSPATVSRYRNGERIPEITSDAFEKICDALVSLSQRGKGGDTLTKTAVAESFLQCRDIIASDKEQFRQRLNTLISMFNLNITRLCKSTNYESSALFRIRNGSRRPSEPAKFAADTARFAAGEIKDEKDKDLLAQILECTPQDIETENARFEKLNAWLLAGQNGTFNDVEGFLKSLDAFDLNEYIKVIHFDTMRVPTLFFQLPVSKEYFGIDEMTEAELDFLKATVLSKSKKPVIMYSDMPMQEMAEKEDFPKKWMFGMALLLKKGLNLKMIHNIDRPFNEMMLGLQGWIPMYMTGQVTPYYLKNAQNEVFLHFLKVSGAAALSGEAIEGSHGEGKYYLTKNKTELEYYTRRAEALLKHANSLMDIYREDNAEKFKAFLISDMSTSGKRKGILSAPPLYTMSEELLEKILRRSGVSDEKADAVKSLLKRQSRAAAEILKNNTIEDEIPCITRESFEKSPIALSLPEIFYENDIYYTYEEYIKHLDETRAYAEKNKNYSYKKTAAPVFDNLKITIHEGEWAMVSKNKSPAIHFVIRHPKLRGAIEKFSPPLVEE